MFYHGVSWALPILSVIIILATSAWGRLDNGDLWCWINNQHAPLRWWLFYGPLLIVILLLIVLYARILDSFIVAQASLDLLHEQTITLYDRYSAVSDLYVRPHANRTSQVRFNMYLYLVCFILIRLPSIASRFNEAITHQASPDWLILLHAMASPLQGLIDGLLFWRSEFVAKFVASTPYNYVLTNDDEFSKEKNRDRTNSPVGERKEEGPGWRRRNLFGKSRTLSQALNKGLSVLTVTWNTAGESFAPKQLGAFFLSMNIERFHIIAFGLQECSEDFWSQIISNAIGGDFSLAASEELGGVRLGIWISKAVSVSQIQKSKEGTGIGNVLTNKGGVGIKLNASRNDVDEADSAPISICFACAHLAAHMEYVEDRNLDVNQLFARLRFDGMKLEEVVAHCDVTFFIGDLNYRIEKRSKDILQAIENKNWDSLTESDQLVNQMLDRNVLSGFYEGKIDFPPTFKVVPKQLKLEYSKKREPAWCDRILFRCRDHVLLDQQFYTSSEDILTSDHRAVAAGFSTSLSPYLKKASNQNMFSWDVSFLKVELHVFSEDILHNSYPSEVYILFVNNQNPMSTMVTSQVGQRTRPEKFTFNALPSLKYECDLSTFRKSNVMFFIKDHSLVESDDLIGIGYLDFYKLASDVGFFSRGDPVEHNFVVRISKLSKRVALLSGTVVIGRRNLSKMTISNEEKKV